MSLKTYFLTGIIEAEDNEILCLVMISLKNEGKIDSSDKKKQRNHHQEPCTKGNTKRSIFRQIENDLTGKPGNTEKNE